MRIHFLNDYVDNRQCQSVIYRKLTHNLNGPRVPHACVTREVTHICVCILDSTRVYTHTQYNACVYVCMATVAIADYWLFSLRFSC